MTVTDECHTLAAYELSLAWNRTRFTAGYTTLD
jgi:hypothetical protein